MIYDELKAHSLFMDKGYYGDSSLYEQMHEEDTKIITRKNYTVGLVQNLRPSSNLVLLLPTVANVPFYTFIDPIERILIVGARDYEVFDAGTIEAFMDDIEYLVKLGLFKLEYQSTGTAHSLSRNKPAAWNNLTYKVYIGK